MITIYTDSSTQEQQACIAFLILDFSTGKYIGSGTKLYNNSKNSLCEMYAIKDALNWIKDNYDASTKDVTAFTDFLFTQNLWNKHTQGQTIHLPIFKEIITLSKAVKSFQIRYVTSHVNGFSPNKACDILARGYRTSL